MFYVTIYIAAICAANLLVAAFGPAVTPFNAFILIALDMSVRDKLHDTWCGKNITVRMLSLIVTAGAISYFINPTSGIIAIASVAAFMCASLADAIVYQSLMRRKWRVKSNLSNTAGAAADSLLFPLIAFGSLMPEVVALQFVSKTMGGFFWSEIIGLSGRSIGR